ncbi:hypothetical protein JCGZ_11171 [Jatropha curcas]|uniref:Uncharacterized protein n=1 Tax=Jatropha curcas TaxID=180498 RepID=A0A067LPJ6_JATCU|nr:hypothetical protein JCGZ_11171 [Jatropha curcas]
MYYLGERVYEWELGAAQKRVTHGVPYFMMVTREIKGKMISMVRWGTTATDHLADFVPCAYVARTQLLIRVPPSADGEPALEEEAVAGGHPFYMLYHGSSRVASASEGDPTSRG